MATGGRKTHLQVIHELSILLTPALMNGPSALLGVLPAGAVGGAIRMVTGTAFDPTTATVSLGGAPGGAGMMAATSVKAVGRSDSVVLIGAGGPYSADQPVYYTPALTGGPATVGACALWLEYLPGAG